MTSSRTRLLAALSTFMGLVAGGFEAHLVPQAGGWWHGVTGAPSMALIGMSLLAAILVWMVGGVASVTPMMGMSAGLLPLVPAITGMGAGLLFFSGYTMALAFAVLLGLCSKDLITNLPRLEPSAVFVISFVFFILVGRYLPGPAGPQGDEPHYLLIAESLLKDADVDLQNQFDERAYSKFTSARLEPHTAPRSPEGRLYALHTPGLSALIAPGYALFGFAGARALVSAVMAGVVSLLFFTARSWFGAASANFVFLMATVASPLPIYANSVFPDSAATLPVAAALACLVSGHRALLGLASTSIAALPWLHPRFLPLAALLALVISWRGGFSARRAAFTFVPLVASLGLLLLHFQSLFGQASLSAAYGPGFSSDVSLARIPLGASALLFDRQFGLLLFAPVLLLGLSGMVELWRRDRLAAALVAATVAGMLATGGSFSMWWGGASSPARFLIAATPALILVCGAAWEASGTRPDRRALLAAASGFGLGLLWLACLAPRALHNRGDGDSGLLRLLAPVLDADRFFAGFLTGDGLWRGAVWGAILVLLTLRPCLGMALAGLSLILATAPATKPFLDPFSSSLRALESWNDHRRAFGGSDEESAFTLEIPLGASSWELAPGIRMYSPRFSLPEGAWTMSVESDGEVMPGALNLARVTLVGDDQGSDPFATATLRVEERVATATFMLGRDERRVRLRGEGFQSRVRVLKVTLIPKGR